MSIKRYLLAGLLVGLLSVFYNFLVFYVLQFYPEGVFEISSLSLSVYSFYIIIFLKNFLVGLILTVLFVQAYSNIRKENEGKGHLAKGIFFFCLFGIFALISFSIGDMFLMKSQEGMLILLTVDGVIESLIAFIPIRLFYVSEKVI